MATAEPLTFRVVNDELGEQLESMGKKLIEIGMGLRGVGFEVVAEPVATEDNQSGASA